MEDGGKGHTREGDVGSVNVAYLRTLNLGVASVMHRNNGCEKQMKTKCKRLDLIVFTNANPRYAGKLDDPQGGDVTMLTQQVKEVMTVNQEMTDESSWIWLTSEQMGFHCGQNLRMRIRVKPEVRNNAMTSVLIKPHLFWRLSS